MNHGLNRTRNHPVCTQMNPMFLSRTFNLSVRVFCLLTIFSGIAPVFAAANVTTYHNDNARTGQNTNEPVLTLLNVNTNSFGRLYTQPVDGFVYAQPLVMTGVNIPGKGVHDVMYIATEHDTVYAFDAYDNSGSNAVPLWTNSFINPAAGVTTMSTNVLGNCMDVVPEIGITSTPVIDPVGGTIYVEAKTQEVAGGVTNFVHRLHALDLATGAEKFGGPAVIQASVAGSGDGGTNVIFNPFSQMNRPGLLLNQGVIYMAFASHCDQETFHGWIIGYDAQTLTFSNAFNVTPNGAEGGIWQAGCGPAADANGNIYCITGNGTFDGTLAQNYSDSFIKLTATNGLALASYFTPFNQAYLATWDLDLNSGGNLLLPDEAGSEAHLHLMVGASKQGMVYLVDRDSMGGFDPLSNNQIVQCLTGVVGGCFSTPAYFNNTLYFCGSRYEPLQAFTVTNGLITTPAAAAGPTPFWWPGATPSVSANGNSNAIVWAIESGHYNDPGIGKAAILHAFNATNVAVELYSSLQAANGVRDFPGQAVKFTLPTVANGRVYVGAQYAISVYGVTNFVATPVIASNGVVSANCISVTITDDTPGAVIYYTLDASLPSTNSLLYAGAFTITNLVVVQAQGFLPGAMNSAVAYAALDAFPLNFFTSGMLTNGAFQMGFNGVPGSNYVLQTSSNLLDWTPLSTNLAITNLFNFMDSGASNGWPRFYRALQTP